MLIRVVLNKRGHIVTIIGDKSRFYFGNLIFDDLSGQSVKTAQVCHFKLSFLGECTGITTEAVDLSGILNSGILIQVS